jgi:hypothetical protein
VPTPSSFPDWKGQYYANRDLSGSPVLVRNDVDVNFNWGDGSPAPGVPADNFSVRWTRTVDFDSGVYRFLARADDGIRVYVSGDLIIDQWHNGNGEQQYSADQTLTGPHPIVVEYYEATGNALVSFTWTRIQQGPPR